jgi:uncharacterized membrane protein
MWQLMFKPGGPSLMLKCNSLETVLLRIVAIVIGAAVFMSAAPVFAQSSTGMTICNQSSVALKTAIGYHSPGVDDPADHSRLTGPFVTRGWWQIEPGACHTFQNPFNARYMYWFGFSSEYHNIYKGWNSTQINAANAMKNPLAWCLNNFVLTDTVLGFTYELENTKSNDPALDRCTVKMSNYWEEFNLVDTWIDPKVNFTGQ